MEVLTKIAVIYAEKGEHDVGFHKKSVKSLTIMIITLNPT
jgi:hypothetical protein